MPADVRVTRELVVDKMMSFSHLVAIWMWCMSILQEQYK